MVTRENEFNLAGDISVETNVVMQILQGPQMVPLRSDASGEVCVKKDLATKRNYVPRRA